MVLHPVFEVQSNHKHYVSMLTQENEFVVPTLGVTLPSKLFAKSSALTLDYDDVPDIYLKSQHISQAKYVKAIWSGIEILIMLECLKINHTYYKVHRGLLRNLCMWLHDCPPLDECTVNGQHVTAKLYECFAI